MYLNWVDMIQLIVNTHDYENDVRVMTQAFYPDEKIVTVVGGQGNPVSDYEFTCRVDVVKMSPQIRIHMHDGIAEANFESKCTSKDIKIIRNQLKRELYEIFHIRTGKDLPWGTLTGIRPCKIPTKLLEEGMSDTDIISHLQSEYLATPKKAQLSLEVAKVEKEILDHIDYDNGYSLYIGIPFCPTTCLYCSFTSYPISMWKTRTDAYVEALCKELQYLSEHLKGKKADSIYIGGGTPTTLLPHQFEKLFTQIEQSFDMSRLSEFTVEAGRPDSITEEKLRVIRDHGIGRISINPQTMNQKTLDLIGRRHSVEDVERAYEMARRLGFDDINMDLIVGLPGEDIDDVRFTLERVKEMDPDNLTVHSLAIKRAARLNTMKEQYASYKIENTDEMIDLTQDYAKLLGMRPYYLYRQKNMAGNFENVGYAKPGKEGVYNILIMEEKQSIYAAGANAQSKIVFNHGERVERIENVKDVANYIERVDEMILRKKQFADEQGQ